MAAAKTGTEKSSPGLVTLQRWVIPPPIEAKETEADSPKVEKTDWFHGWLLIPAGSKKGLAEGPANTSPLATTAALARPR